MDTQNYEVKLLKIRENYSMIESILPSFLIEKILSKANAGNVTGEQIVKYISFPLVRHRSGWLLRGLRKVVMPFKMFKRGLINKQKRVITVSSIIYTIFLCFVWCILSIEDKTFVNGFFNIIWAVIICYGSYPYISAIILCLINRDLYLYIRNNEE